MRNDFSATWYTFFLDPIPARDSDTETAFVLRHLPPAHLPSLLDLCCGPGRHAVCLATHGYQILGIDKNPHAIAQAQHNAAPRNRFMVHDMPDLGAIGETLGFGCLVACAWFNEQIVPSPEPARMQFVFERGANGPRI